MGDAEDRVQRIVEALLKGRRLRVGPQDRGERAAIMVAARLAGARQTSPAMSPQLRRRLASSLQPAPSAQLSRRGLLGALAAAAALGGGAWLGRWLGPAAAAPAPLRPVARGTWTAVAALQDLPVGRPTKALAGDVLMFLTRSSDGVVATSALCSDLPCALSAELDEGRPVLFCPCHRATFSAEGASLEGSDYGQRWPALTRYPARIVNGEVQVRIE